MRGLSVGSLGGGRDLFGRLMAQGLNFLAMMVPIVAGRYDAVAFLLTAGAISVIGSTTGALAVQSLLPAVIGWRKAIVAARSGLLGLVSVAAVLCLVSLGVSRFGSLRVGTLFFAAAAVSLPQGAHQIVVSLLIRSGDIRTFTRARLGYSVANLAGTVLVTLCLKTAWSLALATACAYSVAIVISWHSAHIRRVWMLIRSAKMPLASSWVYVREVRPAVVSALASNLAFQAGALLTPLMGPFSLAWASVARITGGFGGVGVQVVAPPIEMRFAKALRAGERQERSRAFRVAVRSGLALGCGTLLAQAVLWSVQGLPIEADPSDVRLMVVAMAVYVTATLLASTIQRMLVMSGGQRVMLVLTLARLALVAFGFIGLRDLPLLVFVCSVEGVFGMTYLLMLRRRL